MKIHGEKGERKFTAKIVCWLLGNGCIFSWISMLAIVHYYAILFPKYHPARVLPMIYQPFAVASLVILTYYEANINSRKQNLLGYSLFFISCLIILIISCVL
ncbi:hypothetical protein MKW94_020677 [Papaver nudicaule]|uniref:Uncharacterized protein n=1 Tax=Papaver nudicaule TaxID=74823 RepID=A0AA41VZ57_PAPNU|nr:hypothetical protein [Papaver nudicaule]